MRNTVIESSAIGRRLKLFGPAVTAGPNSFSQAKQLIFLCGGNREHNVPSNRRASLKNFIEKSSDDYRVIYAESVFSELQKIGHRKNALDLEHEISKLADTIIIILESESAFCELGAFAHKKLREKLIVINDSSFRNSTSFINTGPIAAMKEVESPVLWYPMSTAIRSGVDGIGATFANLEAAIKGRSRSAASKVITDDLSDLKLQKTSLYFVHDLVMIAGPITHAELIDVLIATFGNKPYDFLSHLLGVLRSTGLITSQEIATKKWAYRSVGASLFLRYTINIEPLLACFRTFHLKANPERFSLE